MVHLQTYVDSWSEAQWELSLAFKGLSDENVWRRPHPTLLSIGELAGHIASYEAIGSVGSWGETEGMPEVPIKSQLVASAFHYYPGQLENQVVLEMGAEEVAAEVKRVHEEAKAALIAWNPLPTDMLPYSKNVSWEAFMRYRVFHVAYHCGQAYSVRHLLGDTPEDN